MPQKKIKIKTKEITIPKLGLKHHQLIKEVRDAADNLKILLDSIHPNLTKAEAEIVMLHTAEFNGLIPLEKDGYSLNDIQVVAKTEFELNNTVYKFRSPTFFEKFKDYEDTLKKLYIGEDEPDFKGMPAFLIKWVQQLTDTIVLKDKKGINEIMDHFDE